MARLKLSQHAVLNGDSWNANDYLGGMIAALLNREMFGRGDQTGGDHATQFVDMIDSWFELLGNAARAAIYKNDVDTALQYSVSAETFDLGGVQGVYAGQTARGPLTAGQTNYIWLDLTDPAAIVAASATTGWPGSNGGPAMVRHRKLGTIAAPASGHWLPQHLTRWSPGSAGGIIGGGGQLLVKEFTYATASPFVIGAAPAGRRIGRVCVVIDTAFNGSSPTLTVGDAGSAARFVAAADLDLTATGGFQAMPLYKYAAQTDVKGTLTVSGANQGAGAVIVEVL